MASRRKKKVANDHMVLHLIVLVALVLALFEGRMIRILFLGGDVSVNGQVVTASPAASSGTKGTAAKDSAGDTAGDKDGSGSTADSSSGAQVQASSASQESGIFTMLAGLPSLEYTPDTSSSAPQGSGEDSGTAAPAHPTVSNPDSPAIVPYTEPPVDDSYFADAVFIGDSRMEGFRNVSGITQGRFFTSVGMSLDGLINKSIIQTEQGNITVAAAVSGGTYNKIYVMLGTNDLGETDMNNFHDRFTSATGRLMEIQPGALMYICSIIYVEEDKAANSQYVNNTNVDKLNAVLLQICEEQGYHYLNLNEFLSDGNGSLIPGASSDGVHMYEKYCQQMLDYLKCHYIPYSPPTKAASPDSSADTAGSAGADQGSGGDGENSGNSAGDPADAESVTA